MHHIAHQRAKAEKRMVWMRLLLGLQKHVSVSSWRANFTLSKEVEDQREVMVFERLVMNFQKVRKSEQQEQK